MEAKDFRAAFKSIDERLQIFKDKDPNQAQSETVCNNVINLKIYHILYKEKQRKAKQSIITSIFVALPKLSLPIPNFFHARAIHQTLRNKINSVCTSAFL